MYLYCFGEILLFPLALPPLPFPLSGVRRLCPLPSAVEELSGAFPLSVGRLLPFSRWDTSSALQYSTPYPANRRQRAIALVSASSRMAGFIFGSRSAELIPMPLNEPFSVWQVATTTARLPS